MIPRRVIKIGGSLLNSREIQNDVRGWLAAQAPARNLVCVGGGNCIEAMRDLSRRFDLDDAAMHWRCIRLLRATYEIAAELFPEWDPVGDHDQLAQLLSRSSTAGTTLVAVDAFYSEEAAAESDLPIGWETTSDSLAAYFAKIAGAEELVLLKSCRTAPRSPRELADAGIVDAAFPAAAPRGVKLRIERVGT